MDCNEQRFEKVQTLVQSQPELFAHHGAVVGSRQYSGSHVRGPYYKLAYREGNRQRCVYLGTSVELAVRVRNLLEQVQLAHRQARLLQRLHSQGWKAFRGIKSQIDHKLQEAGLYFHGNEVRGWPTPQ